jgi:hypothetical protein
MSGDQYVQAVLRRYAVNSVAAKNAAEGVAPAVRAWAGAQLSSLCYSGSFAKGTANNLSTDVDLFISLKADTRGTLKQIYDSLYTRATEQGWSPVCRNVSIGASYGGVKLDLVPGKIQTGYQNYHSLYKRKVDGWTQTNVKLHIDTVSQSGRVNEIRAVKIWRDLHGLPFPSFFLELVVMEALKGKSTSNLAQNVLTALRYIDAFLPTIRILDPANTNNLISDDMTQAEKTSVAARARASAAMRYWKDIIW